MKDLFLFLEDGTVFTGKGISKIKNTVGLLSFYTGAFGYEEVITNPANTGKIILFTFPVIGAYGINFCDNQSDIVCASGVICKEYSRVYSNFRAKKSLCEYMDDFGRVLGDSFDTRAIMVHLREFGEQLAIISDRDLSEVEQKELFCGFEIEYRVINDPIEPSEPLLKAKVIDFGANKTFYNLLFDANISVCAEDYDGDYDAVIISNVNTVIVECDDIVDMVREIAGDKPLVGIGDGAALAALARGFEVRKLIAGHHGNNLPIKKVDSIQNLITTQNHEYIVCEQEGLEITYKNLHDNSEEGFVSNDNKTIGFSFRPKPEIFRDTIKKMEVNE